MNISKYLTLAAYSFSVSSAREVNSTSNISSISNSDNTLRKCGFHKTEEMAFPKWTCYNVSRAEVTPTPAPTPAAWKNLRAT